MSRSSAHIRRNGPVPAAKEKENHMVSFAFDSEHEGFRKTLESFSTRVSLPGYRDRAASTDFPFDIDKKLGDLRTLGIGLPEEFRWNRRRGPILLGLATETLKYGDVNMASAPVQIGLVAGEETIAITLTEPGSGSDASALTTTAKPVDGGWLLTGEKTAISWAMNATVALVYAREPGSTRSTGVSCFVVPLGTDGVTTSHMPGMGCLPIGWGSIKLDGAFVPSSHLVGEYGRGFQSVMEHFDFSRAALGLMCIGAAKQSLDEARVYSEQRETFGNRLSSYQSIAFELAEHATYLEGTGGCATARCGYGRPDSRIPRWYR